MNTRCLVTFSIGKRYKDEVWCDVAPMNAFHILLGRQWLYNRYVTHKARPNTYSFDKDGIHITLLLSKDLGRNGSNKAKDPKFLTAQKFVTESEESRTIYVLVAC